MGAQSSGGDRITLAVAGLIGLVALCAILVVSVRAAGLELGFDEAYNLQIVSNLAAGHGYSSFGALRGDGPWLFDPNVTTGPTVIFPLALLWLAIGKSIFATRLYMIAFAWIYVAGLIKLASMGRNPLISAAIGLATFASVTYLPVGQFIGELPGAALVVWAVCAISGDRPGLAGLLLGLAFQTKFVYVVPLVVIPTLWTIAYTLSGRFREYGVKKPALVVAGAALPTVAFEAYRFASLGGVSKYLASISQFRDFMWHQNINNTTHWWLDRPLLHQKVLGFASMMPELVWIGLGVLLALWIVRICAGGSFAIGQWRAALLVRRATVCVVATWFGLAISACLLLVGWFTQSTQATSRQALPFILLIIPCFMILIDSFFIGAARTHLQATMRVFLTVLLASFVVPLSARISDTAANGVMLTQRDDRTLAIRAIRAAKPASIFADGWWQNPEYQFLTGLRAIPMKTGKDQIFIVQDYQARAEGRTLESYKKDCQSSIYESPWVMVCRFRDSIWQPLTVVPVSWGPQTTTVGKNPNRLRDGLIGIWVNIEQVDPQRIGPIWASVGGGEMVPAQLHPNGSLITLGVSDSLLSRAGDYPVVLHMLVRGTQIYVGDFRIIAQ